MREKRYLLNYKQSCTEPGIFYRTRNHAEIIYNQNACELWKQCMSNKITQISTINFWVTAYQSNACYVNLSCTNLTCSLFYRVHLKPCLFYIFSSRTVNKLLTLYIALQFISKQTIKLNATEGCRQSQQLWFIDSVFCSSNERFMVDQAIFLLYP